MFHDELQYGFLDDKEMTVTLMLDDDSELTCLVVAFFPVQESEYIALFPMNGESEEVFLYRLVRMPDAEPLLENIEDDDEFERVANAYDEMVAAEE